jgi:sugar transferase (PEP-CTERM/EpsH1 system associated)
LIAALALFSSQPLSVSALYSRKLHQELEGRLRAEKFDWIIISSSAMAEYVRCVTTVPRAIDFMDVDSEKWKLYGERSPFPMSWVYRLESRRLGRYEEEIAASFEQCFFVSMSEARLFQQRVNDRPVGVVPNGVDLEYFAPTGDGRVLPREPAVIFAGSMDYLPNIDAVEYFCDQILPLVQTALPQTRFYIVGRSPTRRVTRLGCRSNVTVTGSVPDIRPYLANARVAVAPFRIARGVQNKILEAMAMGLPVVATSAAFQGIQASENNGVRIVNEPGSFARAVVRFLENTLLQRQCSLAARQFVELHHRWEDSARKLDRLLRERAGVSRSESQVTVVRG